MEVRTISRLAEVMSRHNLTELQIEEQGLTVMLKRHPDDVNAVWPPQSALNEEEEISSGTAGAASAERSRAVWRKTASIFSPRREAAATPRRRRANW